MKMFFLFVFLSLSCTTLCVPVTNILTNHDFANMTYREYKNLNTSHKLNRVEFFMAKRIIKAKVKTQKQLSSETLDEESYKINWLGFALGFSMGVVGLIIALFVDKKKKNFLRSTVIGFIVTSLLGAVFLIAFLSRL